MAPQVLSLLQYCNQEIALSAMSRAVGLLQTEIEMYDHAYRTTSSLSSDVKRYTQLAATVLQIFLHNLNIIRNNKNFLRICQQWTHLKQEEQS